jgi:hypothetical protein
MNTATAENNIFTLQEEADSAPVPLRRRATDFSSRELFYELLVLGLANLYSKVPLGTTLFDRGMIKSVTGHMNDNDAGRLVSKAEDWIRLENLVRAQEGQKSYSATSATLAALELPGQDGSLGERMEKAATAYAGATPSPEVRRSCRMLAAEFLRQVKP